MMRVLAKLNSQVSCIYGLFLRPHYDASFNI
jgi:hypothetical protein